MEELITESSKLLSQFLTEKKENLKKLKTDGALISFKLPDFDYNLDNKLDYLIKLFETSFYFEKPEEEFIILAIDKIYSISENGNRRFAATEKNIKEIRHRFISNYNNLESGIPVFVGGMKFSVEHADNYWKDFSDDSNWFIPELLILKQNGKTNLFYNFIYSTNSSESKALQKLRNKLEVLSIAKEFTSIESEATIQNVEGTSPKDKKKWKKIFIKGIEEIENQQIDKIVLSRKVDILLSDEPNLNNIIMKLREKNPQCYIFIYHRGRSSFFGATPELLAKINDQKIDIDALAGSAPRGDNHVDDVKLEDEFLKIEKNKTEHNFVVDHIQKSLDDFVEEIKISDKLSVKKLPYIQHLYTRISGNLKEENKIFNLLEELFPTPAVCGIPKDTAIQLIKKIETHRRGMYSGIIGWFNFNSQAEFSVSIRSALTYSNKVIAYAGNGIISNSEFENEYEETELKLKPILSLFEDES